MFADLVLLTISILGLVFVVLALYYLANNVKDIAETPRAQQPHIREQELNEVNRNPEVRQRRRNEGDNGNEDDDAQHMSKRDILKHEKRRAKIAMKQEEDARREARKEKEERKMEILREKELEKDREFQVKEQLRLEKEAKMAKEYNSWKDPYVDSDYTLSQNLFNDSFLQQLQANMAISVPSLAEETHLPLNVCLQFLHHLVELRKLEGVIDADGTFHLLQGQFVGLEQRQITSHVDLLQKVVNCERKG